jgi:hypothetical protein
MMISFAADAQFSSETVKKIDTIENNTAVDITLNPANQVVIPYLNSGELVVDDGTGLQSFANGTEGQLLSITAGVLDFIDPPASSPLTTKGDIYVYDVDNQRLPVGTDGQLLSADSVETTGLKWIDPPVTTPTTTEGDIIVRGATEDVRLPIGLNEYLLTSDGTTASWQPAPVSTTLDTKGQIQTYSTENAALDVGLDGTFLVADSTEPTGLKYTASLQGKLNPITDTVDGVCTSTHTANAVTTCKYSRVGEKAIIEFNIAYTGATTAATLEIDLPTGLLIDTSKTSKTVGDISILGYGLINDSSSSGKFPIYPVFNDSNTIRARVGNGTATYVAATNFITNTTPVSAIASGDSVELTIEVPIQGWTSGINAAFQNTNTTANRAGEITLSLHDYPETSDLLKADGRCVLEADFPDYQSEVGDAYGDCTITVAGDGMRLPDLRGWFPRFLDNMGTAMGAASVDVDGTARTVGQTQLDEVGGHTHLLTIRNVTASGSNAAGTNSIMGNTPTGTSRNMASGNFARSNSGTESRGKNIAMMPYVRVKNMSYVLSGTFENIDSTDLIVVQGRSNSGQTITAETTPISFLEVKDDSGSWNGNTFTPTKGGIFTLDGAQVITGSAASTLDAWVDRGSGFVKEDRCNASVSSSLQKFTCKVEMLEGDSLQLRSDSTYILAVNNLHKITITQSADYEAIVKSLYADNITECETKILQTSSSSVGALADLTFTGLVVGKKYSMSAQVSQAAGGFTYIRHDSAFIAQRYSTAAGNMSMQAKFVATATTSDVYQGNTNTVDGNGLITATKATLCKLPDTTILN